MAETGVFGPGKSQYILVAGIIFAPFSFYTRFLLIYLQMIYGRRRHKWPSSAISSARANK